MKKEIKGFILGVVTTGLLSSTVLGATYIANVMLSTYPIKLNGESYTPKNQILNYNGATYLPLREFATVTGNEVDFKNNTIIVNSKEKTAITTTGKDNLDTNNYGFNNPANIGTSQQVNIESYIDGKHTDEVKVVEVIRGEEAYKKLKNANSAWNKEPKDGKEYILAKIYTKILKTEDGKAIDVNAYSFNLFNSMGTKYNTNTTLVVPEPKFSTTLYQSAEHEGWIAFEVDKTDTKPKISYGTNYDGTGGVWFKLY